MNSIYEEEIYRRKELESSNYKIGGVPRLLWKELWTRTRQHAIEFSEEYNKKLKCFINIISMEHLELLNKEFLLIDNYINKKFEDVFKDIIKDEYFDAYKSLNKIRDVVIFYKSSS
jgi:hypothetical protein